MSDRGRWTVRKGTFDDLGGWVMGEVAKGSSETFAEAADAAHCLNMRDHGPTFDWSAGPRVAWLPVWERARRG